MFVRTERLFLRPAWPEDAPELTRAIAHEPVVRMLAHAPWADGEAYASSWIAAGNDAPRPSLLVTLPEAGGQIVGGCGLVAEGGVAEVGYWIEPAYRGRGFATEALGALVSLARALGYRRLCARVLD